MFTRKIWSAGEALGHADINANFSNMSPDALQVGNVAAGSWARADSSFNFTDTSQALVAVSPNASPGIMSFSRTSDFNVPGGSAGVSVRDSAWGFGSLVINDNVSTLQNVRNAYFEARRLAGASTSFNVEFNMQNFGAVIGISPYVMGSDGSTLNYWASSGRTDIPGQTTTTCIFGAVNNGSQWTKGFVIGANSIATSITGIGPEVLVMPDHYTITWANPANAAAKAYITSTAVTASTSGQVGLIFSDTGGAFQAPNGLQPMVFSNNSVSVNGVLIASSAFTCGSFGSFDGDVYIRNTGPSAPVATIHSEATAGQVPGGFNFTNGGVALLASDGSKSLIATFNQVEVPGAIIVDGPSTLHGFVSVGGNVTFSALPSAANDAAAATAGVAVNMLYRNGNTVQIRIT